MNFVILVFEFIVFHIAIVSGDLITRALNFSFYPLSTGTQATLLWIFCLECFVEELDLSF